MKIIYWDAIWRQNLPALYEGQLFKVRGYFHERRIFRLALETIELFPKNTFLITINNVSDLYYLPPNVIPVFHASNNNDVDNFRDALNEQQLKVVSLFCHDNIDTTGLKADWFLISGNNYRKVEAVFNSLNYNHECIYLEAFKGSRLLVNIPRHFQKRLIPKKVVYKVIENQFNNMIKEEIEC